jgi:hypothetical protein
MSTKRPGSESVTRRAALLSGAKLSVLGTFCVTIGSTIIAACVESGSGGPFPGPGSGYGYGYGYDEEGNGYGYGGYGY